MTLKINKEEILKICGQINDEQIEGVKSFVIFLGHAHSGHSIIGALLDSHPDISIANEINVPKLILDHKLNTAEIQKLTLATSLKDFKWEGSTNTGYKYKVPKGFQGSTSFPVVLGDKKGGGSTRVIRNNPQVLGDLYELFGNKLKFINVLRDPLDNIAAFSFYWKEPVGFNHVNRYYENFETVQWIQKKYPNLFYRLYHSKFLKDPQRELTELFKFLEVETKEKDVRNWVSIVRKHENKRSEGVHWPKNILKQININNIKYNLTGF